MVTGLDDLIPELSKPQRVRPGILRDIRQYRDQIIRAVTGSRSAAYRAAAVRPLGGDRVARRVRARSPSTARGTPFAPSASSALLRVYHADPLQPEAVRAAERIAIANAYDVLVKLPSHDCVVGCLDFFPSEDESQYVLVLEDVSARALLLHLTDPQLALTADGKLRVIRDMLRGLAHAHANRVLHRALSPTTVLVTSDRRRDADRLRLRTPRGPAVAHSVVDRLARGSRPGVRCPRMPESHPQAMSRASDVYAAGVIAFHVLTGELPFASTDRPVPARQRAAQPARWRRPGCRSPSWTCCAGCARSRPTARPSAAEALEALTATRLAPPAQADRRRAGLPEPARGIPAHPQVHGPAEDRQRIVRRRVPGVRQPGGRGPGGEDRATGTGTRWSSGSGRSTGSCWRLPPHPNVVKVENADYLDGRDVPYLVFEYLDGQDVSDLVKDRALGPADTSPARHRRRDRPEVPARPTACTTATSSRAT